MERYILIAATTAILYLVILMGTDSELRTSSNQVWSPWGKARIVIRLEPHYFWFDIYW